MKVLVAGATGLIGRRLCEELLERGHTVVGASRSRAGLPGGAGFLAVDFATVPGPDWWAPALSGVDVVVNAVGVLRPGPGQDFAALHTDAPRALFLAGAAAGVQRILQVSALGSDAGATTPYHLSKRAADDALRALAVPSVIVQPSLVYAPQGASATLFQRLAVLPLLPLPAGAAQVQPVHIDDVTDALVRLVEQPATGSRTLAFVGPAPLALDQYLATLRSTMGFDSPALRIPVPPRLCLAAGRFAGRFTTLVDRDAVAMLLRGNVADAAPFTGLLGRAPRPAERFIDPAGASAARLHATLDWLLPPLRASIAFVWLWTAFLSFGGYPVEDSLALLREFGLSGPVAQAALYAGAAVDLVLGLLLLLAPARWRGPLWAAQIAVIAGYTLLITLRIPHWWLHPFGPISKNLPMLMAIALAWALEHRKR